MSGKAEEQLAEAEKRTEKAEERIAELMNQLEAASGELANAKNTLQSTQRELDDTKKRLSSRCNELMTLLDEEKKSHAIDLKANNKKVADLQGEIEKLITENSELGKKCNELEAERTAMIRSIELSKPENAIPNSELPSIQEFIDRRNSVYQEYMRAQERTINECIKKASAANEIPMVDLASDDPSFTFEDSSGCRFRFICLELLEKIRGKDNGGHYTGWVPMINCVDKTFGNIKRDVRINDITGERHDPDWTACHYAYTRDFPRSNAVANEYGKSLTIIAFSEEDAKQYEYGLKFQFQADWKKA